MVNLVGNNGIEQIENNHIKENPNEGMDYFYADQFCVCVHASFG
jgi:hypothetical protein